MTSGLVDRKIVILGTAYVGKTSIIQRYCNGIFQIETLHTIGSGFFTHTVTVDDTEVTLFLWDTAGTERFKSITPSLLRDAHGLVLVYDVSEPSTFSSLDMYLEMFLNTVNIDQSRELPVLVLGNKNDLGPVVSELTVNAWCEKNGITHNYRVSAKTGQEIDEAMASLVKTLITPATLQSKIPIAELVDTPVTTKKCC
jgi:small GTP-binding protein